MSVITIPTSRARVRPKARYGVRLIRIRHGGVARVGRARFVAVALLCVAALAAAWLTPASVGGGRAGVGAAAGGGLGIVPVAAAGPISAVLGRDLIGYRVVGLAANNPVQRFSAVFSRRGVTVRSGRMRLGLTLDGYGYATAVRALAPVRPAAQANRVLYARGAVLESWTNGPAGLEQAFTVASRPRAGSGPLTFALGMTGDLRARLEAGGVSLLGAGGALRYDALVATDSRGRSLRAWFAFRGRRLLLEVDDRDARYPLRVDPLLAQSGELISSDGTAGGEFGGSVAVSGDTVVVGAKQQTVGSSILQGAVYVFVQPAAGWQALGTQTAELTASNGLANDELGASVAVSGNAIVAGAPGVCYAGSISSRCSSLGPSASCVNACHYGVAYVFVAPAGGWSGSLTQSAELTASNLSTPTNQFGAPIFGTAVAVSGGTIVVGGGGQTVGANAPPQATVYVFQQPAGGWSGSLTQSAELTATDGNSDDDFGGSLAVSGETIVVGAPGHGYPVVAPGTEYTQGAAYVFQQPGGGWSGSLTQSAELTAPVGAGIDELGSSVAVSGSTVAASAPVQMVGSNLYEGAVYVYTQPPSGWSGLMRPSAELTASDGTAHGDFGAPVAASGNTIAAHGAIANGASAVYVYVQPAAGWSGSLTQNTELAASNETTTDAFGDAVAMSGATVIVGAPDHRRLGSTGAGQGAAYVFTCPVAASASRDRASTTAVAPPAGGCPLKVTVTVNASTTSPSGEVRSGLAVHSIHYRQAPVDFLAPNSVGSQLVHCESGCVDVTVEVTDQQTGDPVKDATVNASVGDLSQGVQILPDGRAFTAPAFGDEFLCETSQLFHNDTPCGTHLIGLKTNKSGHVFLHYWAPGVLASVSTTLNVTAKKTCSADQSSCPVGQLQGVAEPATLTVEPYLIYDRTSHLSEAEDDDLAAWADGGDSLHKYTEANLKGFDAFVNGAKWLKHLEIAVKDAKALLHVAERFDPWAILLDAGLWLNEKYEADLMISMFLEKAGLSPFGVGYDPVEDQADGAPSSTFTDEIVALPRTLLPSLFGVVPGGFWYDTAQALRRYQDAGHDFTLEDWSIQTSVYEVSHCDPHHGSCGPGYASTSGAPAVKAGIEPELVFELSLSHDHMAVVQSAFHIVYDAIAWTRTQAHLKEVIQDFK